MRPKDRNKLIKYTTEAILKLNNKTSPINVITAEDLNSLKFEVGYTGTSCVYGYYDSYGEILISDNIFHYAEEKENEKEILATISHELVHFIADKYFGEFYYEDNNNVFMSLLYWLIPEEAELMYDMHSEYNEFKNTVMYNDIMKAETFEEVLEYISWYVNIEESEAEQAAIYSNYRSLGYKKEVAEQRI